MTEHRLLKKRGTVSTYLCTCNRFKLTMTLWRTNIAQRREAVRTWRKYHLPAIHQAQWVYHLRVAPIKSLEK
jgi:hypothetical protein